jgi:hypothetical protein
VTSGASGDLQQVTSMARQMVINYGMSDIGPWSLLDPSAQTGDVVMRMMARNRCARPRGGVLSFAPALPGRPGQHPRPAPASTHPPPAPWAHPLASPPHLPPPPTSRQPPRSMSENLQRRIDEAVKKLSVEAYEVALQQIQDNREAMDRIVEVLMEKETISGDEFRSMLSEVCV